METFHNDSTELLWTWMLCSQMSTSCKTNNVMKIGTDIFNIEISLNNKPNFTFNLFAMQIQLQLDLCWLNVWPNTFIQQYLVINYVWKSANLLR